MKYFSSILLCIACLNASDSSDVKREGQHSSGTIEVMITNVDCNKPGNLIINLYTEESWNKPEKVFKRLILYIDSSSEYTAHFNNIPIPNDYAVQVVHDSDGNGKLSMKWLPPGPKEGAGVSNYVPTSIPKYQKARFYVTGKKKSIQVVITYPD